MLAEWLERQETILSLASIAVREGDLVRAHKCDVIPTDEVSGICVNKTALENIIISVSSLDTNDFSAFRFSSR